MIYIALAALAVSAVTAVAFVSVLRSLVRQQARERDLLLNQMMNLAGKPWQPAPANERPEPLDAEPRFWTTSPEQGI